MKIKSAYTKRTPGPTISCGQGITEQHHKNECDVNNIMARFIKTGNLSHANQYEPQYGEQTSLDLHSALNIVTNANSMFMELPSKTRAKFNNDPGTFLDYVQDGSNHEEMYQLGLATKPPPVNNPPAAAPETIPEATPPESP